MIRKMKSRTFNNSLTNIKDSKNSMKRIHNLSNRIQSLQNDIDMIQNSKKKNKNRNIIKIESEKNYSMIMNDSNIKENEKNNFSINKTFVKNPYFFKENLKHIKYRTSNNSQIKNNPTNDINHENFIYKKIKSKNYNQIIHGKRDIFLNINSNLNKNEKRKEISIKNIPKKKNSNIISKSQIKSRSNNFSKFNHFLSVDKINTNLNLKKQEKFEENKKQQEQEQNTLLDIEYELRSLKKRMKFIMNQREELNSKLLLIKNKNKKLESNIISEQNKNNNIIKNLIMLNDEYFINKNQNELDDYEDNTNYQNTKIAMKDILFNIMDMKIEYEKNILYDKFIEGLKELLSNIQIFNISNSDNNISNKINRLLHLKNKLQNYEEKYSIKKADNDKYYIYFTSLLNEMNLKSFEELKEYIINIFIKNIKENKRMKEITSALISENESLLSDKKAVSPKRKYIINALNLNKKEKNAYYKNRNKGNKNMNLNSGFRNNRKNSYSFQGFCYNSFLNINNKRNLYNTKIDKKYFRSGVNNINNKEMIKLNYFNNDNDIQSLKDEEEKN
jgi:hypothetical protein